MSTQGFFLIARGLLLETEAGDDAAEARALERAFQEWLIFRHA